jgi:serine/threonine protein kinase
VGTHSWLLAHLFGDLQMTRPEQDDDGHAPREQAKSVVVEFISSPAPFPWDESTPSRDVETKTSDKAVHVKAIVDVETRVKTPSRIAERYKVIGELGVGGQAHVYLAEDTTLRRKVAIKISKPGHLLSQAEQEQFKREAQAIAALKHPGIVTVHDFGIHDDGRCFIVLEYLPGQSLKDCLKNPETRKTFTIERTLELISRVAEALHYAHQRGIYHRDLKPGNILLDEHGNPHISDFGLAVTQESQRHLEGQVAGTIPYMAPEQVRGEAHWLNGQADIWALGVILYEMLAGRRPFQGLSEDEVKREILGRTPTPLRQIRDEIPEQVEQICRGCLERDLQHRFSVAHEVSESLLGLSAKTRRTKDGPNPPSWKRFLNRRSIIASAVIAAIMAIAGASLLHISQQPETLVIGEWNDVSKVPPRQLAWRSDKEEARWRFDAAAKSVEINTEGFGLLKLGTIQYSDYDLRGEFSQTSFRNDECLGFFIGHHSSTVNDRDMGEFQGFVIGSNNRADIPNSLDRVFIRYDLDRPAPPQAFKFSPVKVVPRDLEWLTLEIRVRNRRVSKIFVNENLVAAPDNDPDERMIAQMSKREFLESSGPFGVYFNGNGHGFTGMYRRVQIRPFSKIPQ